MAIHDLNTHIKNENNKRLRGERVNQVSKDLKDKEMTDKEKVLRYSEHLAWFLKSTERVYKLLESARVDADKTSYAHGIANGLILAMAVLLEEQGDIPAIKAPPKYRHETTRILNKEAMIYIHNLERLLYNMIAAGDEGPKGYEGEENAFDKWFKEVISVISNSPVEDEKTGQVRAAIREFLNQTQE